jgi:hypothetical protein
MTGKHMKLFLTTLFAAIESEYLDLSSLRSWADRCIEAAQKPRDWLVDLSMASSGESALDVLRAALPEYGVMLDESYGELLLGFWYQRLGKGELSEDKFANECIDILDAYEIQELDGTEFVNEVCSESLTKSLKIWASKSEENLNRLWEMQFVEAETAALGII